jgi:hypothetical protein
MVYNMAHNRKFQYVRCEYPLFNVNRSVHNNVIIRREVLNKKIKLYAYGNKNILSYFIFYQTS